MTIHFRTLTAVVEVDDDSELRYPGIAHDVARSGLEAAGFRNVRLRNAPNYTGQMPEHEAVYPR
jgi:hypothetical protein